VCIRHRANSIPTAYYGCTLLLLIPMSRTSICRYLLGSGGDFFEHTLSELVGIKIKKDVDMNLSRIIINI
jgi:hypothetical protein